MAPPVRASSLPISPRCRVYQPLPLSWISDRGDRYRCARLWAFKVEVLYNRPGDFPSPLVKASALLRFFQDAFLPDALFTPLLVVGSQIGVILEPLQNFPPTCLFRFTNSSFRPTSSLVECVAEG